MTTADSMLPRKSIIILVILSMSLTCLALRHQRLTTLNQALAEAQAPKAEFQRRIAEATAVRDATRQELRDQRRSLEMTRGAVAKAEKELARVATEVGWTSPPASGPEWDNGSPYIWLGKNMLAALPGSPLTERAELRDDVAAILALDTTARQTLNEKLARLMVEYHTLEAEHAERIEEPLPGIANDGPHVTVRVLPFADEGDRLQQKFKEALQEVLGQQRSGLVLESAAGWLDSHFAASASQSKTISVVRHPNGTYNLSIQTGNSWFSTGGFKELSDHVPDHLLPLFSEALENSAKSR